MGITGVGEITWDESMCWIEKKAGDRPKFGKQLRLRSHLRMEAGQEESKASSHLLCLLAYCAYWFSPSLFPLGLQKCASN